MSGVDIGPIPLRQPKAAEVYAQAALLATDDRLAAWCRTMAQLTAKLDAPHPLPVHAQLSCSERLGPEGMAMQRSMWFLLCQRPSIADFSAEPETKLSTEHALAWCRVACVLQAQGVGKLALQFTIELECILTELARPRCRGAGMTKVPRPKRCIFCDGKGFITSDEPYMQMQGHACVPCNGTGREPTAEPVEPKPSVPA